jgi:hypothetical protein
MKLPPDVKAKCLELARKAATVPHELSIGGPKGNPRQTLPPDARWMAAAEAVEAVERPDDSVLVVVPVRTVNPTNGEGRGKHRERIGRGRREREATLVLLRAHEPKRERLAAGCVVTLTRVSAGRLSPIDGLGPALKHVRDAVAMWLLGGRPGELDEDSRIGWDLQQRNLGPGKAGVIVSIRGR